MDLALGASRLFGVQEEQLGRAGRLVALVLTVSFALVVAKAAQSGIFLASYTRADIPWAFAGSAALLATLSALSVAGAGKLGPARLAQTTLALSCAALVLLAGLLRVHVKAVAFVSYCVIEAIAGVLLIQVWSVVSAAVDPRSAKRILPIAGVGASIAWTVGGLVVPTIVKWIAARGLLLVAGALVAIAVVLCRIVVARDLHERSRAAAVGLIEGWKQGMRLIVDVPLVRLAMIMSVVALLTEQLMDFQMMVAVRERASGDATAIASFFGRYYGITSALGTILLMGASGRMLARFGAPQTLAITPIADFVIATIAAIFPTFGTFVALRGTDRVLKSAIFTTSTEQVQTPLGAMQRSQSRALVRGVLGPLAYGALAVGLGSLPEGTHLRWVAMATGMGSLLLAAVIVLRVRRAYVRALQQAIDDRKLVLDDPDHADSPVLDRDACRALEAELASGDPDRAALAAELLADADGPEVRHILEEKGLGHEVAAVRRASIEGLARLNAAHALGRIARHAKQDVDPGVRLEAVRALRKMGRGNPDAHAALDFALKDEEPRVRALARIALAEHDDPRRSVPPEIIVRMLRERDRESLIAALAALRGHVASRAEVQQALKSLLSHEDVEVRVAALRAVARLRIRSLLGYIIPLFDDPRTAPIALARLSDWGDNALGDAWAAAATDDEVPPSTFASPASLALSPTSSGPIARLLAHPNAAVRAGAASTLGRMVSTGKRRPLPRSIIEPLLMRDIAYGYGLAVIGAALDRSKIVGEPRAFLAREIELEEIAIRERILLLLGLFGNRRLARSIEMGMKRAERAGHVAELLELTLADDLARRVVPLFETASAAERAKIAVDLGIAAEASTNDLPTAIFAHADEHIMGCAMITVGPLLRERNKDVFDAEARLIPVFERMRFLRRVPLFAELSGEDLRLVANIVEPAMLPKGHVIFKKGDPGEDLYVIAKGHVSIRDGQMELAILGALDFFGELAVLDREPRSADAVCTTDAELLRLRAADFGELMSRRPPIQRHVMIVLVRRLREMTRRLSLAP
jgi:hypothetical protein